VLAAACGREARSPTEQWQRAVALWREQDVGAAYRAWTAIDPASAEGVEARRRLALAEQSYRRGIERLRSGAPGSREALVEGTTIAPMDPALYLPLARACRDRGLDGRASGR
jgi:hypothetical protein